MKKFVLYGLLAIKTARVFALSQGALETFLAKFGENIQVERNVYALPYKVNFTHLEVLSKESFETEIEEFLFKQEEANSEFYFGDYPSFQENFEKYSREEIFTEYKGSTPCMIRIIDYDSILGGLGEEYENQARQLEKDENFLIKTIEKWVEGTKLSCSFEINNLCEIPYEIDSENLKAKEIKDELKKVFIEMTKHKKTKETLILTLISGGFTHKKLSFSVSTPYDYVWVPYFDTIKFGSEQDSMKVKIQGFYHEFNHRIHDLLGFHFDSNFVGEMNSQFEQDFFKFQGIPSIDSKKFYMGLMFHGFFMGTDANIALDKTNVPVDVKRALKVIHLNSYWDSLEEIWNIIGFANISDQMYINKMSDLDLLETGIIHHGSLLSDNNEYVNGRIRLGFFKNFFKKNDSEFWEQVIRIINQPLRKRLRFSKETGDSLNNYPMPRAWKYLLQLHGLESNGFDYKDSLAYSPPKNWSKLSSTLELRK